MRFQPTWQLIASHALKHSSVAFITMDSQGKAPTPTPPHGISMRKGQALGTVSLLYYISSMVYLLKMITSKKEDNCTSLSSVLPRKNRKFPKKLLAKFD